MAHVLEDAHDDWCYGLDFAGDLMATTCSDSDVKLWDVRNLACDPLLTYSGHSELVFNVTASSAGDLLFGTSSDDHTLQLWTQTGEVVLNHEHPHNVSDVAWMGPDEVVTACDDGTVRKIEVTSGREVATYVHGDDAHVNHVATLNNLVASGGTDGRVEIHQADDMTTTVAVLSDHEDWVNRLAFVDEERIISASADKTAKVWNFQTGEVLARLTLHTERLFGLAIRTDTGLPPK